MDFVVVILYDTAWRFFFLSPYSLPSTIHMLFSRNSMSRHLVKNQASFWFRDNDVAWQRVQCHDNVTSKFLRRQKVVKFSVMTVKESRFAVTSKRTLNVTSTDLDAEGNDSTEVFSFFFLFFSFTIPSTILDKWLYCIVSCRQNYTSCSYLWS